MNFEEALEKVTNELTGLSTKEMKALMRKAENDELTKILIDSGAFG